MSFYKTGLLFVSLLCITAFGAGAQTSYGDNAAAGKYVQINGLKHYYELYGNGAPILLIHGNSTGIKGWAKQIEHFSKNYTVYAIDCRGRGKSELGKDSLTYRQQAEDMAEFIQLMKLDSVMVIGKSDGAIVALMMGIYYPSHLKKIVSFAANLTPDSSAMYSETVREIHAERMHAEQMMQQKDSSKNWYLEQQKNRMMEFQPNLSGNDLKKINIPVLVMSCDRDVIREEHSLYIYKNIPFSQLCIVPGETHHIPKQNPELFNLLVEKFLQEPYKTHAARFAK